MKRSNSSSLKSWPLPLTFTISISPPSVMSVRVHVAVAKSNGLPARLTTMRNRPRELDRLGFAITKVHHGRGGAHF